MSPSRLIAGHARRITPLLLAASLALWSHVLFGATAAVAGSSDGYEVLDDISLEALAAPVALYPDELLAIVLPAATFPVQIVQARRFLEARTENPTLEPDADWDDSVVALMNYPEALVLLDSDLGWTSRLGEAVIYQQPDLIRAIETFRNRAYAAGNLRSDEYQNVEKNDSVIAISSADDATIYVPFYEPAAVIYPEPVYYNYSAAYPAYYYPYGAGHSVYTRPFWGLTSLYTIGWSTRRVHLHQHHYRSHPYYRQRYAARHYRRQHVRYPRYAHAAPKRFHRNYRGDEWGGRKRGHVRPRRVHRRNEMAGRPGNRHANHDRRDRQPQVGTRSHDRGGSGAARPNRSQQRETDRSRPAMGFAAVAPNARNSQRPRGQGRAVTATQPSTNAATLQARHRERMARRGAAGAEQIRRAGERVRSVQSNAGPQPRAAGGRRSAPARAPTAGTNARPARASNGALGNGGRSRPAARSTQRNATLATRGESRRQRGTADRRGSRNARNRSAGSGNRRMANVRGNRGNVGQGFRGQRGMGMGR